MPKKLKVLELDEKALINAAFHVTTLVVSMLGENIKLLFKLWYRPVSAMSDIIDRGNWLFGAALVTATAFLLAFTVTNRIYKTYESTSIPPEERLAAMKPAPQEISPSDQPQTEPDEEVAEDLEWNFPETRRLPLPVVGNLGYLWCRSPRPACSPSRSLWPRCTRRRRSWR